MRYRKSFFPPEYSDNPQYAYLFALYNLIIKMAKTTIKSTIKCSYFFAHIKAAEACEYVKGIRKTFVRFALNQKLVLKEFAQKPICLSEASYWFRANYKETSTLI